MRLRPNTPIADEFAPFGHDLIDHQAFVELLTRSLVHEADPAVLCVNGKWGSGKSTLLQMLAAHLKSAGRSVITLSASNHCWGEYPTEDLLAAASAQLASLRPPAEAAETPWQVVDSSASSLLADPDRFFGRFHDHLGYVALGADGPLFVLVDELDRCSPQNVADFLGVVSRAFHVPGVIVVLAASLDELENRIRAHFGIGTDAAAMVGAFVDTSINIPPLLVDHLMLLADTILSDSNQLDGHTLPSAEVLAAAHEHWNLTPRDVGKIALRVSGALDNAAPPNWFVPPSPTRDIYAVPMTALAALHVADRGAFKAMFPRPIAAHAVAFKLLSTTMLTANSIKLVAMLLTVALRNTNSTAQAFSSHCQTAGFSDPTQIQELYNAVKRYEIEIRLDKEQLDKLVEAFEFRV